MSTIDDGGPVYPVQLPTGRKVSRVRTKVNQYGIPHPVIEDVEEVAGHNGINLRDYLASRAMPAVIAKIEGQATDEDALAAVINEVATVSYRLADAMLAARKVAA